MRYLSIFKSTISSVIQQDIIGCVFKYIEKYLALCHAITNKEQRDLFFIAS